MTAYPPLTTQVRRFGVGFILRAKVGEEWQLSTTCPYLPKGGENFVGTKPPTSRHHANGKTPRTLLLGKWEDGQHDEQ